MGMRVVRGEREKGRWDLVVRERESMAGLGLVGVVAGLGFARRRWRGCVSMCLRGRGRERENERVLSKNCVRNETFVWEMKKNLGGNFLSNASVLYLFIFAAQLSNFSYLYLE